MARAIAFAADMVQVAVLPMFAPGLASPFEDGLDVVVGIVMVLLLGWHPAFLPALVAELIPGLDLFPTWTAAVWFATWKKRA